jgi:trigger factor
VKVSQDELTQYLIQGAAQYNMEPGEFIKVLDSNGQIPGMIGEVARGKALAIVLSKVKVVDSNGDEVDMTEFTAPVTGPTDGEDFVEATAGVGAHEGTSHGDGNDSHGRSANNEHYGHDHK